MLLTIEKLKARLPEIIAAAIRDTRPIDTQTCPAAGHASENAMAPPPPSDAPEWRTLQAGEHWGGDPENPAATPNLILWGVPLDGGHNHWLRARIRVPEEWRGQQVLVTLDMDPNNQFGSIEAILYLDGQTFAGIDQFHHSALLPESAHTGDHEVLLRCFTPAPQIFGGLKLQLRDAAIGRLAAILYATTESIASYRESDPIRYTLLERINRAYNRLDLREGWQSERFAISVLAALGQLQETLTSGLEAGQRPIILSTGHAHLDTAWLWPLWRTHQKAVHTVATALHLMERYPDYHFSMSQPQIYTFIKQDDPQLYERLRQRIEEGRFEPVGMMWIESDCNVPSGESLVRQFMYGKQFFDAEFSPSKHILWLPDVFGYSAALPQILRGCGIDVFMTTKISWNQFNRMPCDTFRWRGIDGTEVLTHFVTATDQPLKHPSEAQFYTYNGNMTPGEVFGTWNHYRQKDVNDEVLYIFGHGDGGGGPTEAMLEVADVLKDLPGFPQVHLGRVEQYFTRLYERVWDNPNTPTWVGELYLEYHRGTYTSQSRTKQNNRDAELLYREAEWLNAWAVSAGATSRQAELDSGWRTILLNQFHDILPGSSVPQVYVDSEQQFAEVRQIGTTVRDAAIEQLLTTVPADSENEPALVVLNSLPWERTEAVEIALEADQPAPKLPAGIRSQEISRIDGGRGLLVETSAPSYGLTALKNSPSAPASAFTVRREFLNCDELRLELDHNGEIASLYDRRYAREIIAPGTTGNQLVIYEDRPLFWEAWDIDAYYPEKPYPVRDIIDWRVVEEGPVRAAIEITRRVGKSTIRQRICMWHAQRRIDFITEVDWQERQTLLRTLFPLRLNTARATCEIQFGAVERPSHRNTSWDVARFEVCAHRWVDMDEGGYGVAIMNTGKYGHSLLHNTVGISLLKSAIAPDPQADRGMHRFTYSIMPHAGDWRTGQVTRRAYELNAPLRVVAAPQGAPDMASFLSTDCDHIVVETIKTANDGDGLIVRLYEAHNQRGTASLRFAHPIASAVEVNLLEHDIGPVTVDGTQVSFSVRPFEVKTLRVRF